MTRRRQGDGPTDSRAGFPARSNPSRATVIRDAAGGSTRSRQDSSYPSRCNPNPSRPPLSEAQRELATRYLPLARSMAHRVAKTWPAGADDFHSAACLALVEAAQAFDPSKRVDFATFARYRIRGALIDSQRGFFSGGWRGGAEHRPRFQALDDDAEARGCVVGAHAADPVGASLETRDDVEHWLRKLPRLHAAAFRHLYLDGKTQEEAAALVGCSKSAMCRLHREAIDWFGQASYARKPLGGTNDCGRLLAAS